MYNISHRLKSNRIYCLIFFSQLQEKEEILKMNNKLIAEKRELEKTHDIMKMETKESKKKEISLTEQILELHTAQSRSLKNENQKLEFFKYEIYCARINCKKLISFT